ncbi:MAG: MCE family protein [Bacteroidaceae bacterium]|nr:MCE family protein [Bacteroidaceae bacterium]
MKREIKIGITGIVALVLLFFGMNFLKGIKLWDSNDTYFILFKDAKALSKSSTVYADGYNIGIVSNVSYDYNHPGNVVVAISVNKNVKIPHGTVAALDEAMLGGCTLNMTMGPNPADRYMPGDTIIGSTANGIMSAAAEVMPKVQQVLDHVDSLIQTINTLANSPNLPRVLENAERITVNLDQSSKQLNTLLHKDIPQMTSSINKAGENAVKITDNLASLDLQSTLGKVNSAMDNVQAATDKLNNNQGSLGLLLNDTSLYGNLNTTVNSATNLLEDLKQNPSRYVHFSLIGKKAK